jgi:hypothetical protein
MLSVGFIIVLYVVICAQKPFSADYVLSAVKLFGLKKKVAAVRGLWTAA